MSIGDTFPPRVSVPNVESVVGVWTGGGATTDMTHSSTDWNRGVVSVKSTGVAGKYTIAFIDVPGAQLVSDMCKVLRATGAHPLVANVVAGSYSVANKTVALEVYDGTTLADLATTDKLLVNLGFSKSPPDK